MADVLGTPIYLKSLQPLRIVDGAGMEVKSLRGKLWITQDGDREDSIVDDGRSFVLDRAGLSLVTALNGPAIVVVRPAPALAQRPLQHARECHDS
jgi:hypothetical protein